MKLLIGSHVSVSAPDMLLGAVRTTIDYGANTFMFYTGAPQNTMRKSLSEFKIEEAKLLMREKGIDINNVIVHAPYIINLANIINEKTAKLSLDFLLKEMNRVWQIGCRYLVIHPGSHIGCGSEVGVEAVIKNLNQIFQLDHSNVMLLIETMAGKGSEIGCHLDEIETIIKGVENRERIGVCLDTCHLHDSGVNLATFNDYLHEFKSRIGLQYIRCIHINDSKNERGAHKDRHENIGLGQIGFENLLSIIYHPDLQNVPKILETPYIGNYPPYKVEIEMIKERKLNLMAYNALGRSDL